ncbi:hypothetical protein TUM12370_29540 [Salmonella enterica subsp. enterica serovar Choleraesuis]|nr:hypothetical protein TUM12370_29540 [Salmonella enterica subsp. enterica serovar Choleraesuis]
MNEMLIYNVFGRHIGVKRKGQRWQAFRVDLNERKYSRLYDITLPDELREQEIAGWLGDIFHEYASPRHPEVIRIE